MKYCTIHHNWAKDEETSCDRAYHVPCSFRKTLEDIEIERDRSIERIKKHWQAIVDEFKRSLP